MGLAHRPPHGAAALTAASRRGRLWALVYLPHLQVDSVNGQNIPTPVLVQGRAQTHSNAAHPKGIQA